MFAVKVHVLLKLLPAQGPVSAVIVALYVPTGMFSHLDTPGLNTREPRPDILICSVPPALFTTSKVPVSPDGGGVFVGVGVGVCVLVGVGVWVLVGVGVWVFVGVGVWVGVGIGVFVSVGVGVSVLVGVGVKVFVDVDVGV